MARAAFTWKILPNLSYNIMPLINAEFLALISHKLRIPLEKIAIGGVNEWESTFSNGYGLGDANTLVIDMRPTTQPKCDVFTEASSSKELLSILESIEDYVSVSFVDITHREQHPGFIVVMRLRAKNENSPTA